MDLTHDISVLHRTRLISGECRRLTCVCLSPLPQSGLEKIAIVNVVERDAIVEGLGKIAEEWVGLIMHVQPPCSFWPSSLISNTKDRPSA